MTLTKKSKALIVAATFVLIFLISFPYIYTVSAVEPDLIVVMKNLKARGIAVQTVNDENLKSPAKFVLGLTPTEASVTVKKLELSSGTIEVGGATFTITNGNGAVLPRKHVIVLQATGTDAEGQGVTLSLVGRYFWIGKRLFFVRMAGKLQTETGNSVLLMLAAIRL